MARKPNFKVQTHSFVRDLNPKDADAQYYGSEPLFETQPDDADRQYKLGNAFNWYSKFYSQPDAKDFYIQYLEANNGKDKIKFVKKAPDHKVHTSRGWMARLSLRGLVLNESELARINEEIDRLVQIGKGEEKNEIAEEAKPKVERKNIQEIMREKASEAAGELEGFFDEFCIAGYPKDFETKKRVSAELGERNILPQHVAPIINHWEKVLAEYVELQGGKDAQLNEAYARMSKMQVRYMIKFIESVIADLHGYASVKKAMKAPRKRKAVPVEKVVAKLKHMKAFKDEATKLDLVGLSPVKLHHCTEAWVYDTAKRKMHHYIADEYAKSLTVKGNTLFGFDPKQSEVKTLRKPAEQIKALTGSKPAARKYFKDIKAVATAPNGRFNDKMIILKAF
jgi:hypothetical protein